ncbi:MAG: hypothetical protein QXS81_04855 [Candidatus Micrarchaeaceae archaeon]
MDLDNLIKRIGIKPPLGKTTLDEYTEMVYSYDGVKYLESIFKDKRDVIRSIDDVKNYYNEVSKRLSGRYTLEDVMDFANDQVHKPDWQSYNETLGLFISAAVNRIVERGEKIEWTLEGPINALFYKLNDCEVHINEAGDELGYDAENSEFYVKEARNYAGHQAKDSMFSIKEVGNHLGENANNCEFYVGEAGDDVGNYSKGSKFTIKKAGNHLGDSAERCEFNVGEAGGFAGSDAKDSKFTINIAGNWLGYNAKRCEFDVNDTGIIDYWRLEHSGQIIKSKSMER